MADTIDQQTVNVTAQFPNLSTKKSSNILNPDGSITQTERVLTARARYAAKDTDPTNPGKGQLGGNRGSWGYIKLITSQTQYEQYAAGSGPRTIAYKDLIGVSGDATDMSDPQGTRTQGYDKFLITGVSCSMNEKTQVTQVFGDNEVVYYFGREPIILNISGVLIDSPDNDWFAQFAKMYSEFLRGSQLAKNYELLKLVLPNMAITGTMSGFSWTQDANRDVDIPFSFQFIAKVVEPTPAIAINMPTSNLLNGVDFSHVAAFTGQSQINSLKGQVANLNAVLSDPTSSLAQKSAALAALGTTTGGVYGSFLTNSRDALTGVRATIDSWNTSVQNTTAAVATSSMFQTVESSLAGVRLDLLSPVYGIMSSLTKLVRNTLGSAESLIAAVARPIANILRDVTNISNQAISLVNLVNTSVSGLGRYVSGTLSGLSTDFQTAISTLGKAAGAIGTAPITVSQSIQSMFSNSALNLNTPFLTTFPRLTFTRPSLPIGSPPSPSKATLLVAIIPYSSSPSL